MSRFSRENWLLLEWRRGARRCDGGERGCSSAACASAVRDGGAGVGGRRVVQGSRRVCVGRGAGRAGVRRDLGRRAAHF